MNKTYPRPETASSPESNVSQTEEDAGTSQSAPAVTQSEGANCRHHWLPIIIAIYLTVSFIITYSIAVGNDHVEPGFPYISDTGTKSPESCVFGQLMNIGAVIAGVIIYIRYKHCLHHFKSKDNKNMLRLNTAAFIIGILTIFGVSLVGNFQQTNVLAVHLIGAFLAFGVGFVYMVLQTIITYNSKSIDGNTFFIRLFRVLLCAVDVILLLMFLIGRFLAKTKGSRAGNANQLWAADEPGTPEHLVAAISEWLAAFVTVIYFATFYNEFKHFRMKPPEVVGVNV